MPRVAPVVPADDDILCESCGYTLNGLPQTGNCPECGQAIADSLGEDRVLSAFEAEPSVGTFLQTSMNVLLRPTRFYRSLATRHATPQAVWFARIHRGLAAILFALAVSGHIVMHFMFSFRPTPLDEPDLFLVLLLPSSIAIYLLMHLVTRLAAWLTTWEARYRGFRLPLPVVLRGLNFHYVHYVPVAALAAITVCGYIALVYYEYLDPLTSARGYLYLLSGEVVVCSMYLFSTYWIAMKNMMYANR